MIHLEETIQSQLAADRVFRYVADFAHLPEWDPGIVSACRLTPRPIGLGTRFDVVAGFLGRRIPLRYEVTHFDPPRRVALRGEAPGFQAEDDIQVESLPDGRTRIRYRAAFDLGRFGLLTEPFLRLPLAAMGKRALAGLVLELDRAAAGHREAPRARKAATRARRKSGSRRAPAARGGRRRTA